MFKRLLVAAMLAFASIPCMAADFWGVATVGSYHFKHDRDYNEFNPGLGFEYGTETFRVVAGKFQNSTPTTSKGSTKNSNYLGLLYVPFNVKGVKLGAIAGVINGYAVNNGNYVPIIVPTAVVEGQRWGANISVVPPMTIQDDSCSNKSGGCKQPGAISLQVKYKF